MIATWIRCLALVVFLGLGTSTAASPARHEQLLHRLVAEQFERSVADTIALTEIPAPPFAEGDRANAFVRMLTDAGLADVGRDREGNVLALLPSGRRRGNVVVVAAHLDSVFPGGTDVRVRRSGQRLTAPGVADNARGLAVLLAVVRSMVSVGIQTQTDILFVGTVGEEGAGDLRGVRYLLTEGEYRERVTAFIALDGINPARVVNRSVGSRRYRSAFSGPGGHSYSAFGTVNPVHALAATVTSLQAIAVPATPRTTYSASIISGGTSVNAIPAEAVLEVDLRSESQQHLEQLEASYLSGAASAVATENVARGSAGRLVSVTHQLTGNRPAGETSPSHPLVALAVQSLSEHGFQAQLAAASTDSNIPMSLGIPALTLGVGGRSEGEHSLSEWLELPQSETQRAMQAIALIILRAARAGIAGPRR
ncbi:MAG: peptidase M20 [Sphingopyxis sp.]|jgi:acetylornithine deacetylase/succinyl-diaminopimelate desuccinylase-like protein|nr:peptidase M20 [Sphingopyxis sp.]